MENIDGLKIVTIRIKGEEDLELIRMAMKESGNATVSKSVMQILEAYRRLLETNKRLSMDLRETRAELHQLQSNIKSIVSSAQEFSLNIRTMTAKMTKEVEETSTTILQQVPISKKERQPPKGWSRKS